MARLKRKPFYSGTRRIEVEQSHRTVTDALNDLGAAVRAKTRRQNDQRAHESFLLHQRITGEKDLPDPNEVKIVEKFDGQKTWAF